MPTDKFVNADQDQDQIETTDQVEDSVEPEFNAKKASKTLSEQINKIESKYEQRIAELEAKLNPVQVEEPQEEDPEQTILKKAEALVEEKLTKGQWMQANQSRIENLSEENQAIFNEKAKSMSLEDALVIAEAREPYKVQTKEQLHPRSAPVSREPKDALSSEEKAEAKRLGISEKAYEIQRQRKEQRSRI